MTHIHLPHAIHLSSRPLRRLLRFVLVFAAVSLVLLALAFSALRLALPHLPHYREEVQNVLSHAWGAPVQFGSIDVAFVNYRPQLVLTDLKLGTDGPFISRFGVSLAVWRSLTSWHWVAGKIVIDKPHLAFVQQADNRWALAGAPQVNSTRVNSARVTSQAETNKQANSWSQWLNRLPDLGNVSIQDARIEWIRPAQPGRPELHQAVTLNAVAKLAEHGWSLSGELFAPGFGASPVRMRADGRLGEKPTAELYLAAHQWRLPAMQQAIRDFTQGSLRAELGGCGRHVEGLDCSAGMPLVNKGLLTGELWLRFAGASLRSVSADFDLSHIKVTRMARIAGVGALATAQSQADLNRIAGRLIWQETADGWRLDADQVRVVTANDIHWPVHSVHLIHRGNQTEYASSYVDLHQLSVWLATAPLPRSYLSLLGQNALRGDARDIRLRLVGDTIESGYLELQHFGNVPGRRLWPVIGQADGLGGLNLKLYKQPSGWLARFDQSNLVLAVPGMFREPMTIDALKGDVYLHDADSSRLLAYSPGLYIKNADLFTNTSFRYQAADKSQPAKLAINSTFGDIHVDRVPAYLPRNLLGKDVLHWLDTRLQSSGQTGLVDRGQFVFNGDPARFPFMHGGGWFSVIFDFKQLNLPFLPHWPELEHAKGNIAFVNQQFHASIDQGSLAGMPLNGSRVSIFNLDKGLLDIAARAQPPVSDLLHFLQQTPLLAAGSLDALKVTGQADLAVSVRSNLNGPPKTTVKGQLALDNNTLSLKGIPINLSQISGTVDFHDSDFSARNVTARFANEPVTISIEPAKSANATRINLQTRLDPLFALRPHVGRRGAAESTAKKSPNNGLESLVDRVQGKAQTRVDITIPHLGNQFTVRADSNLVGVSSQLPAPFGKAADSAWPLRADLDFSAGTLRQLDIKSQGSVSWQASLNFNAGGSFSSGAISNRSVQQAPNSSNKKSPNQDSLNQNSPNQNGQVQRSQAKLAINLDSPVLDVDAWQPILAQAFANPVPASADSAASFELNIQTDHLKAAGLRFGKTRVHVGFAGDQLRIRTSGYALDGQLSYQQPGAIHPAGYVSARFKRFYVAEDTSAKKITSQVPPVSSWDLKKIPGADVIIDDLRFGTHRLGKLALNTQAATVGRDKLAIPVIDWQPTSGFSVIGQGAVTGERDKQQTEVTLSAQGANIGDVIAQVTADHSPLTGGEVKSASARLSWPGAPVAFAAERLSGAGAFTLLNGQLNDVNPGAGRLVGLLSLGGVLKVLKLDFSELADKGLPFDSFNVDWKMKRGVLKVDPLVIQNASMKLEATGESKLSDNSLDYTLKVYADMGLLLPIIGTVAGGPVVGGAVLALQQAIKAMDKNPAPTLVYRITGTLADPVVKTVKTTP